MAKNKVKNKIINSFFALLKEKPFLDISITEMADRAGVSRISFYRNFGSFDELMKEAYEKISDITVSYIAPIYEITDPDTLEKHFDDMPEVLRDIQPNNTTFISNIMQMSLIFKDKGILGELSGMDTRERYVRHARYYVILSIFTEWFRNGKNQEEKTDVASVMIELLQKMNELLF